jgi:tetratricopeptide (TPR) repeat protein
VGVFAIAMAVQLFLVGRRLGLSRRGPRAAAGAVGLLLLVWLSSGQTVSAADAAWWRPEWNYRRHVRLEAAPKQSSRVAWVRFSIPDQCHAAGADVRIVDSQGNPCRMSLLFYDPALYGVVAFEIPDNQSECWLYQGNPAVSAPAAAWEPQAGVFLLTARLNLEAAGNNRMQDMVQSLRKPNPAFGAGFRAQIWDGFDPFGEPSRFAGAYTAWLRVSSAGPIVFCAVSTGGSVMRIDGKEVCRWRGSNRGSQILPEQTGTADLAAGIHKLEFHHFGWDGEQTVMVGWKKPADKAFQVIPAEAYVAVRSGVTERLEKRDAPLAPDFECQEEEWLATPRFSYFLYGLSDVSGARGKIAEQKWSFADGETATGPAVEKMFFQRGDPAVTLAVRDAQGNSAEIKRPVRVLASDKLERVTEESIQTRFVQFLRNHPLPDTADRQSLMAAAYLCDTAGKPDEAIPLYRRLVDRSVAGGKGQIDAEAMTQLLGLAMNDALAKPEETADYASRLVAALPGNSLDKAALTIAVARLQLRRLARPGDALTTFQTALQCLPQNALRQTREREALIGTGDAQRAMGHAPEAEEAYRKAQALPPPAKAQDYDVSSFALTAEATIRDKEFDEAQNVLDRWQEMYPVERLTGYASVLQSRIYAGRGLRPAAIAELETFLGCSPQGVFAQTALEDVGGLYEQGGDKDKARAAYDRILAGFQDPLVRQRVQARLQALEAVPTASPTPGQTGTKAVRR